MPDDYLYEALAPAVLRDVEIAVCKSILVQGGAASSDTAEQEIPRARSIAVARHKEEIVGLGTITRPRPSYARSIGENSRVRFAPDLPELGYVAVSSGHRGRGVSKAIVAKLLEDFDDSLFATTSSPPMRRALRANSFERRGRSWELANSRLSLWIHDRQRGDLRKLGLSGWIDYDRDKLPALTGEQRIDYFEWRVRQVVLNPLERILETEITPANSSAVLIFGVALCCAIEATGKFITGGRDKNGERFKEFLDTMDPAWGGPLSGTDTFGDALWKHFRNGLAHGFAVCHGGFEGDPGEPYFRTVLIGGVESLKVNPSLFFDDYAVAFENYLEQLRTRKVGDPLLTNFNTVFEDVFVKGK